MKAEEVFISYERTESQKTWILLTPIVALNGLGVMVLLIRTAYRQFYRGKFDENMVYQDYPEAERD